MAAKCQQEMEEQEHITNPTHNGVPIPPWTETAKEYLVIERFPHLQKRFETGLDCLTIKGEETLIITIHQLVSHSSPPPPPERLELQQRAGQLEAELKQEQGATGSLALHGKVSLLAGGNLAHVATDAVVNASNCWLTTGKGDMDSPLPPAQLSILPPPFLSLSLSLGRGEWITSCSCWPVSAR